MDCFLVVIDKVSYHPWIKKWLCNVMHAICVEDIYASLHGFYEIALHSQEYRNQLLTKLPIFYGRSLVHVVPWRPLIEYQDNFK